MMQDMATMQQSVTSPEPAQDSMTSPETDHESSRTDLEHETQVLDLKCQNNNNESEATKPSLSADSDNDHSEDEQETNAGDEHETKYVCPICDKILTSQHDFTLHIRSHNNTSDTPEIAFPSKGYSCKICSKVLSSSSSLDRHVLVHSGERPFKCRVCLVAFTTNGNMHRHMRTHNGPRSNDYDSEGSTDSTGSLNVNGKSPGSPTNNNNTKKRRTDGSESDKTPEVSPEPNNNKRKVSDTGADAEAGKRRLKNADCCTTVQRFWCPVCEREDFASLNVLETHLESAHPGYKVRCSSCDLDFKNHRVLNLHRYMVHRDKEASNDCKASVLGFKDLTFMDFSSEKFPHIARTVCEQQLHQPTSRCHSFQCDRCGRAFPCGSALSIHKQACFGAVQDHGRAEEEPTDLSRRSTPVKERVSSDEEEEDKKREDFFAGLDLQNKSTPTSPATIQVRDIKDLADIQSMISAANVGGLRLQDLAKSPVLNGSLTPSDRSYSDACEEEQQDCFASEFRRMKLKGEFPCRLCTSVFPNLRALKGHNRAHLVSGNVFRCNMCPYSNPDKAILIRHMRSHNGDRPYECGLCNYAFTTKANCERHLRNRHSKLARDEVKKSIIYHPSEDPTNDVDLAKLPSLGDAKRSLNFEVDELSQCEERYQSKSSHGWRTEGSEGTQEVSTMTSPRDDSEESSCSGEESEDGGELVNLTSKNQQFTNQREAPLDLSMDALDLSKRNAKEVAEPQDLSRRPESNNNKPPLEIKSHLQAQLMAPGQMPKVDLNIANFYAANQHPMYPNAFPFPPQPFISPYFVPQQHPLGMMPPNLQEFAEMRERNLKELIRGLQMSGGTILDPMAMATAADKLQQLHQQAMAEFARKDKLEERVMIKDEKIAVKIPLQKAINKPRERDNTSVKMVIKNGVLMPKQKQRRYRTERPFFCEHCSARFTLRSNMERHIKQQHPEYWTQRQRGNVAGGRRNLSLLGQDSNGHEHKVEKEAYQEAKPRPEEVKDVNINKAFISNEVKNAIALQLKSKLTTARSVVDVEEDELVIDEEAETEEKDDFEEGYKSFKDTFFRGIKGVPSVDLQGYLKEAKERMTNKREDSVDIKGYLKEAKERMVNKREESVDIKGYLKEAKERMSSKREDSVDLASVSRLLDNATTHTQAFQQYFQGAQDNEDDGNQEEDEEEDEEGLVAASDNSGSDENRSDLENGANKKKSAYSLAPNRVSCPYCHRKFPWSSSLRRHVLTHTGQKPYKCAHCPLLFTTKSNCDRHLLRKHANTAQPTAAITSPDTSPPLTTPTVQNSTSYTMRNVPERPYKCNHCPSSTFSTLSNLKKHVATKHPNPEVKLEEEESLESEEEEVQEVTPEKVETAPETVRGLMDSISTTSSTSDLPFKCHLCEGSYGERQDALEHIKENHPTEFMLLVSKGALENGQEDNNNVNGHEESTPGEESLEQLRGKFPDYANRKVMCAFCLRRFWSAEDLRRHMRTHTGERPFSCDICRRRFTLKHSMLRHRKKHSATDSVASPTSADEDNATFKYNDNLKDYLKMNNAKNVARSNGYLEKQRAANNNNNNNNNVTKANRYIMQNPWPLGGVQDERKEGEEDTDLIGNLLGIRDKSIIDKMLVSKSADDAAILLGVGNQA